MKLNEAVDKAKNEVDDSNHKLNQEAVDKALKKYEENFKALENKKYLINGGIKYGKMLLDWITVEAEWKAGECVAIYKLREVIEKAINDIEKNKTKGEFFLELGPMQALNVLMQKQQGKGYQSAVKFKELFMPLANTFESSIKADQEVMKRLEYAVAAAKEGIDVEEETLMAGIDDKIKEKTTT
jgi:hypothetical protein